MKFNFIDYIKNLYKENKGYYSVYEGIIFVNSLSDVPEKTDKKIYIVGVKNRAKWVVFKCPDGCGRRVEVNLMKTRYPKWEMTIKKKKVSLYPSVIVNGCKTHFWLDNSTVLIAKEDIFDNEYL